jgi:Raf kinase inhibitor-like YbhB/YbcL family protein
MAFFKLFSTAFPEGGTIPKLHTCEGADLSPEIEWSGEPPNTKSFALIFDDTDAPSGTWNHWLLWNIPASVHALAQGVKPERVGESGTNDFGKAGYSGPAPPKGHGPHRYYIRLFALDIEKLDLRTGAKRADLDQALGSHVLEKAVYMGRYERKWGR